MILHVENLGALDRLTARFHRLVNPDASPLMLTWMNLIVQDNRKGVLAGLDKDGNPLARVTYRPIGAKPTVPTKAQAAKAGAFPKRGKGEFQGLGADNFGNLSSAQYRKLAGPPLAPRGVFSRVVTNLKTEFDPSARGSGRWEAYAYWDEIVNKAGKPFMQYHFHGIGQIKRDLTGVRPEGVAKARTAAWNWMMDIVHSSGA